MYSTCTVARAENEELAAWAALACPDLLPGPLSAAASGKPLLAHGAGGTPHMARFGHPLAKHGVEDTISFFCCKFRKISSPSSNVTKEVS